MRSAAPISVDLRPSVVFRVRLNYAGRYADARPDTTIRRRSPIVRDPSPVTHARRAPPAAHPRGTRVPT
eukprot:4927421-Prymnesium_polylepis.1